MKKKKLNYEKRKEIFESKHAIGISINIIFNVVLFVFLCTIRLLRDTQIRTERERASKIKPINSPTPIDASSIQSK